MKKYFALSILTIIIFGTLTISTAKIETPFDGDDTFGFPLTFLIRLGGKRFPIPENWTEIFYSKLFFDIAVAFLLAIIVWTVYTKLRKNYVENKSGT